MNLFNRIHDENIENYGKKYKNTTSIVINQYNDRTHFIFELLQNAEDAGAEMVAFELKSDCLIIEHDGNEFNENDIRSICALGESTKAANKSGIGKFGIGFKSVYSYTKTPCIYSGNYSFRINDCIFPEEISPIKLVNGHTVFKLMFNHDDVPEEEAYAEIASAFEKQLDETSVLMLNNIHTITVSTPSFSSQIKIDKRFISDDKKVVEVNASFYDNKEIKRLQRYFQFTDNEEYSSMLLFKEDGNRIVKTDKRTNYIYSYFPTSIESHQNFLIQAPFNTTPARDNIKLNDAVNKQFVKNICELIKYSFIWLRDTKRITIQSLSDVYPTYHYDERNLLSPLYDTSIQLINSERLLPIAESDDYVHISDAYVAETAGIIDLIDNSMLRTLEGFGANWVEKSIINTENYNFFKFIKDNSDIRKRSRRLVQLVDKMDARFFESKKEYNSINWFTKLFQMIENNLSDFKSKVSKYPFVRLSDGRHIVPYDSDKNLHVYLNNPEHCEYKIDKAFLSNDIIKEFYSRILGIEEYNELHFVMERILPKYNNPTNDISFNDNCSDITKVIKVLSEDDGRVKNQLSHSYIVKSGDKWYTPQELNIPITYSEKQGFMRLFEKHTSIMFLDDSYFKLQNAIKVKNFISLGCMDDVKYINVDSSAYYSYANNYGVDSIFRGNMQSKYLRFIEGLEQVLKRSDEKTSVYIAHYFTEKISRDGLELTFFSKNCRYETIIGILLNYIPWMYTKEHVKVAPSSVRRESLSDKYIRYESLLDALSFQDDNSELKKMISERTTGETKDLFSRLLDNPEELRATLKFLNKKDRKEARRNSENSSGMDPLVMLNGLTRVQFGDGEGWDEMSPESITDKSKRKNNFQKEFEESMQKKTSIIESSSIRFSYMTSSRNKDEKEFLRMNYQGRCQICNGTIVDYKNQNYFEAINIIDTRNAPDYVRDSVSGWNSLSLCPNCAAKMKVCSKDLSDFARQVLEYQYEDDDDDMIPVSIILKGEKVEINYTPKHFIALQQALEFFNNNTDNG